MLNAEVVNQQDAIEKIVCEKMRLLKRQPLTDKQSELLIKLIYAGDFKVTIPDKEKPFMVRLIEKRIEHFFTFKIVDFRLTLFLAALCESPGNAVMVLWYLQYWCFTNGIKEIDLDIFSRDIAPIGLFYEDDLQNVWDSQKVKRINSDGSDNLLDYVSAGQSIQFK